jgi:hypothetical protein
LFCIVLDSIIKQYLQNLHFYENKREPVVKFNSLFKFGQETPKRKLAVKYNSSINILRKSILTNLYILYSNDQWNLSTLKRISTLFDNSTDHYLEAELLLILHISKFKIENVTKIEEIIKHVIPIKTVLLSNQVIRVIERIYFTLTKKQIDKNDLKKIINDIHIEFVRATLAHQLRGFSGRKKIYINADHFLLHHKYEYCNPSLPLELLELDLLALIFHESMHTILRDIENNYNLTTPTDYAEANIQESGACIEKHIFSCCPDWVQIYENGIIRLPEIISILNAFKTDQPVLSLLPQGIDYFVRNVSMMALDITSIDFGKPWEV